MCPIAIIPHKSQLVTKTDFASVERFSWDMYGGQNKWNGDLAEIHFVAGSFGNRGSVGIV